MELTARSVVGAVAVVLALLAVGAMAIGEFLIAGLIFLSVSLIVFLRETRL